MKPTFIYYTHSDYSDIWPLMIGQHQKYMSEYKAVLFTDKADGFKDWDVITYDPSLTYRERVLYCLDRLVADLVVFNHEDMFLFKEPLYDRLETIFKDVGQGSSSFVKLIRVGQNIMWVGDDYLEPEKALSFTIQPTVCKKKDLQTIFSETKGDTIWEFEVNTYESVRKNKFKCFMLVTAGGQKRGMFHWDSNIYPYVATAVVKGKWNTSEYPELAILLRDYGINPLIRGVR